MGMNKYKVLILLIPQLDSIFSLFCILFVFSI